ncbi:hypothetical protein D3C85_1026430 [compost metagenome]
MVLVDAITLMRPTPRIHAPYTSPTPLLRGFVRVLSNTGIFFKKNARCLKSNVKAAAYAAQCRFCYAHRAGHTSASAGDTARKRPEAGSLQKPKTPSFFPQNRWKAERRDRCFSVGLKYKDPLLKIFFKGPSEKIFFLTLPGKNSVPPRTIQFFHALASGTVETLNITKRPSLLWEKILFARNILRSAHKRDRTFLRLGKCHRELAEVFTQIAVGGVATWVDITL